MRPKLQIILSIFLPVMILSLFSCSKTEESVPVTAIDSTYKANNDRRIRSINLADTFATYLIRQGNNYMENNTYPYFSGKGIKFKAIFDSSCIYSTVDPTNQADINKLYGFADSLTFHQVNSARFGWNWMNGKMHIHAYCYVSTVRIYKELGTVNLNEEVDCALDVLPGQYIFTLNGKKDTMQRACPDTIAQGYLLYPYFGGDEPAPHDIRIKIKDIK